jgi:hypothetical protein
LEEKWPVEKALHLITACNTFSHGMQQNLKKSECEEKGRPGGNLGGQLGMVKKLVAAVIEDNYPILWYLSKSHICLLIRHGESTNH